MRIFLGQTRSRRLVRMLQEVAEHGVGEMTQPSEFPPRRKPWMFDCETYPKWVDAGMPVPGRADLFDEPAYFEVLAQLKGYAAPECAIVPDIVAGGAESLAFSLAWVPRCIAQQPYTRWLLAVQDGMLEGDVRPWLAVGRFGGLFVGGTEEWKWGTAGAWVALAHEYRMPCHIGRARNAMLMLRAKELGADSVDTCEPLWSRPKLASYMRAFFTVDMF